MNKASRDFQLNSMQTYYAYFYSYLPLLSSLLPLPRRPPPLLPALAAAFGQRCLSWNTKEVLIPRMIRIIPGQAAVKRLHDRGRAIFGPMPNVVSAHKITVLEPLGLARPGGAILQTSYLVVSPLVHFTALVQLAVAVWADTASVGLAYRLQFGSVPLLKLVFDPFHWDTPLGFTSRGKATVTVVHFIQTP